MRTAAKLRTIKTALKNPLCCYEYMEDICVSEAQETIPNYSKTSDRTSFCESKDF